MHIMADPELKQDRLGWLPPDVLLSQEADTLFFVGCAPYFDVIFADLGVKTLPGVTGALRLLNHADIPFKLLENERCCGHDLLLQGDRKGFMALARANMKEFAAQGIKRIITHCPEGYYTFKVDYPRMLGETGLEVLHLTEVLTPLVQEGSISLGRRDGKVAYHDPCMLGRCSRLFDEPRSLLGAVEGLEVAELEQSRETALCCGSSPWAHCGAVNRQIQERLLAQAQATGAEAMVTPCPKCQIHLKCAQKIGGQAVPQIELRDMADLLAESLEEEVR
jgi:Fe-S oxidoreductase